MENLKIKVNSEEESKEAQELFFELGYGRNNGKTKEVCDIDFDFLFAYGDDLDLTHTNDEKLFKRKNHKQISLGELRALVSLHKNPINMDKVLKEVRSNALGLLKDKEYLRRNTGGTYSYVGTVHPDHVHDLLIEIPEGSNIAVIENYKLVFYSKYTSADLDYFFKDIVWLRQAQPEELPFVDDECYTNKSNGGFKLPKDKPCDISKWSELRGESLNDQYAEIEKVRQEAQAWANLPVSDEPCCVDDVSAKHNHYFIDVSDVDEIDFYEIALRYNVTDPCIQHILKKCLAVGNRGHKDFHTDLKDIHDTAARALRIHGA